MSLGFDHALHGFIQLNLLQREITSVLSTWPQQGREWDFMWHMTVSYTWGVYFPERRKKEDV